MPKSPTPPEPPADWRGFTPSFYTQVPDEFFDVWLPHLSGAECKVLCYLMRHTFGWKKTHDRLSFAQITRGIVRRTGERLDGGAGVSLSTAQRAIDGLVAKGLIAAERTQRPDGGDGPTRYYIRMNESASPRYPKSVTGGGGALPILGNTPYPASVTQETGQQEILDQEDSNPPAPTEEDAPARLASGMTVDEHNRRFAERQRRG